MIGYVPLGKMDTVHHITTYLCAEPGLEAPVWNCGEMGGRSGKFRIIMICESKSLFNGQVVRRWGMVPNLPEMLVSLLSLVSSF